MDGRGRSELRRVLKPGGHVFLNVGWNTKHPWRSIDVLLTYRPHFALQNAIAWIKSLAIDGTALPDGDLKTLPALKAWLESVGLPTSGKDGAAVRRGLCTALRADLHERTIGHMPSLNSDYFLNPVLGTPLASHADRAFADRPPGDRCSVRLEGPARPLRSRPRRPLPRRHLADPLRDHPEQGRALPPSEPVSGRAGDRRA